MSLGKTIELNIVHGADSVAGSDSGYTIELHDITHPGQDEVVFVHGGNTLPASPFKYSFQLHEAHLKFGNAYRVKASVRSSQGHVYTSQAEFGLVRDSRPETIGLKLARG